MNYLKLIRYPNLLLLALVQVLLKYSFFPYINTASALTHLQFAMLVVATLCIAAAGNVINDIYDVEIDKVNKPNRILVGNKISEKNAYTLFIILNIVGVALGFYLANAIGKPGFAALFIIFSALLYLYASYLKGILLVGNILVSILVAMSLIIVPIFDLLPAITLQNQELQAVAFRTVMYYGLFAFFINFIREIIKDLQDINGDKKGGMDTLAIALGRKRATHIAFFLGCLLSLAVIVFMCQKVYHHPGATLYFLFAIVAPLLLACIKMWDAKTPGQYAFLSSLLKLVMFLGICSIPLMQFVLLG